MPRLSELLHQVHGTAAHLVRLLQEGVQRLAQGIHNEANLPQSLVVEDVAAIKDEGRLLHLVVDLLVVVVPEDVPLSEDADGMCTINSSIRRLSHTDILQDVGRALAVVGPVPFELGGAHVTENLIRGNLRIKDGDMGTIANQALAHINGRSLTSVTSVLLEGKAIDGNLLPGDGVEHSRDDTLHEPAQDNKIWVIHLCTK